ncbi:MAG: I78 family peptidase inhibitor [Halomonas sp.]|nr:I78 family peptidase inhibitor [Halomonas sp.]MDP3534634.1 I78 family peptidase inhibitor [Halomonas sp.]
MVNVFCGSTKRRFGSSFAVLLAASLLTACASGPEPVSAPAPPPPTVGQSEVTTNGASCNSDVVQHVIGEPFNDANVPQLQSESGARQVRVLRPDSVATMDYREDRLNIHLDSDDNIEALRCG